MATTFPTTIDNFTNPQASDKTDSPSHAGQHADLNDAVEALQAKVGVDSSAVTTSHDYKLANLTVGDITDLTATAAELNTLDGITSTVAELNKLDGFTGAVADLNKVDGLSGEIISGASKLYVESNWGYIVGNATDTISESVTFDVTFDSVPIIILNGCYTVQFNTSPTSLGDFVDSTKKMHAGAFNPSTTGFDVILHNSAGTAFSAANSYGYTWLAIGTYTA